MTVAQEAHTWIANGAPPVIAATAYFESSREKPEDVGEFLVAVRILGEHAGENERKKTAAAYISHCRQVINAFIRYNFEQYKLGRFVTGMYLSDWETCGIW